MSQCEIDIDRREAKQNESSTHDLSTEIVCGEGHLQVCRSRRFFQCFFFSLAIAKNTASRKLYTEIL